MNEPIVAVISLEREYWSFLNEFAPVGPIDLIREREFVAHGMRWVRVSGEQDVRGACGLHPKFVHVHGTALRWGDCMQAFTLLRGIGVYLYPGYPGKAMNTLRILILQEMMDHVIDELRPGEDHAILADINYYKVTLRVMGAI